MAVGLQFEAALVYYDQNGEVMWRHMLPKDAYTMFHDVIPGYTCKVISKENYWVRSDGTVDEEGPDFV